MATPGSKLNPLLVDELIALRAKGYSIRRIAAELDLSRRTVHKYVKLIAGGARGDRGNTHEETASGEA